MNSKNNFLDAKALKDRADAKLAAETAQTQAVEAAVDAVLKDMEAAATKLLNGLAVALAADVYYDLDHQTESFSITLLAEAKGPDMAKVREKFRSWRGRKTFPFKIPNLTSRQNTLGAFSFKDGEEDDLLPDQVGLVFVFVEW